MCKTINITVCNLCITFENNGFQALHIFHTQLNSLLIHNQKHQINHESLALKNQYLSQWFDHLSVIAQFLHMHA